MPPATSKSKPKRPARRRKRKSRTEVSSSEDSSSSSSDSSSESEYERPAKKAVDGDVAMRDIEEAKVASDGSSSSSEESEPEDEDTHNAPHIDEDDMGEMVNERIPTPLARLRDPSASEALTAAKFEEYYMRLITTEFADSLDEVRKAQDFGDNSLPMLVRQLKQGVNIFALHEKETVVEAEKRLATAV